MRPAKRKPAGQGRVSDAIAGFRALYGRGNSSTARLPENWRDRLPDPVMYYAERVGKLGKPNGDGWAQGRCPFHDDHDASLSVNVTGVRGGWRCFAGCGAGDMVAFHRRMHGLDFAPAVRELLGARA